MDFGAMKYLFTLLAWIFWPRVADEGHVKRGVWRKG